MSGSAKVGRNALATRARVMRAHVTEVSTEACLVLLNFKAVAKHGPTARGCITRHRTIVFLTFSSSGSQPNMMKTRRKSKAAAAAAAQETATRENSPAAGPSTFTVTIPEDVDFDALTALLPDANITNPSSETIVSLYRVLLGQTIDAETAQRELEEARAEIQRKEIELDQALQDRETATSELESTLETVQKDLAQVKEEKDAIGTSRVLWCHHYLLMVLQPPNARSCKSDWILSQALRPRRLLKLRY